MPVRGALSRMLPRPHERNLRSYKRAVGGVERDHGVVARLAGTPVRLNKLLTEALAAARSQVEHEEREVVGDVELAQLAVKLQAVDDPYVAIDKHVVGAQVPVSFANASASSTHIEHASMRRDEGVGESLEREHPVELAALLHPRKQLVEVLFEAPLDRDHRRATGHHTPRTRMELREYPGDRDDLPAIELTTLEPRRERVALVVAAHLDHELDRARIIFGGQLDAVRARSYAADA